MYPSILQSLLLPQSSSAHPVNKDRRGSGRRKGEGRGRENRCEIYRERVGGNQKREGERNKEEDGVREEGKQNGGTIKWVKGK